MNMTTTSDRVRFMTEHVRPGLDPFTPGAGGINFEKSEVTLEPVEFDVTDDHQRDIYLSETLDVSLDDLNEIKDYASVVVNESDNTAAVIVYRPAVVARYAVNE